MKNILVVEDDLALARAIVRKLKLEKFGVFQVDNVASALEIINKEKIDAIWLDHYLVGDKSGLDLVCELKSGSSNQKNIPVFIVSNTASPEKVKSYIELGVNKYYTKAQANLVTIINDIKKVIE